MSRPLRIEYEGAWYHVMNRGLARTPIFLNDNHRLIFLELLSEIHNRYHAEIHAYCLMGNHYHLFIRTPLGNLSRIMRHLDGVYTQRFNRSSHRDGPIFRGRYKAILVEADVYLLSLSRYIHLNPVTAKIVKQPEHYRWSSYQAYLSGKSPVWLSTGKTLSILGERCVRHKYKTFVDDGIDKEINKFYKRLKCMPILGTEAFTKTITEKYLKEEHKISDIPEHKLLVNAMRSEVNIDDIVSSVAAFYGISRDEIYQIKRRAGNKPKKIVMYIAAYKGRLSFTEISLHFCDISVSGVSKACKRILNLMRDNYTIENEVELITQMIGMSNVKT